jgi:heterodisulfide reductase subunit A2
MNNVPVLIVGGGPAGLAAAHALASVGQRAVLVEKEKRLGVGRVGQGRYRRHGEPGRK